MDRPKINNQKEFALYLKVLAEESVRQAYREELNEADPIFGGDGDEVDDPEEEGGEKDIFGDEGEGGGDEGGGEDIFGGGDEGGEEGEAAPEEPAPEAAPEPPPEKEKVEVRPTPLTLELGQVTSDGLIATMNMIRAGRSFKEADVASEMRKYFEEQLSDSERLALATFLSAIRDVTSGKAAKDAPDPGDENINIDATEKEREQNRPQGEMQQRPQQQRQQRPAPTNMPRGGEDTTAPIQVGQRNESVESNFREYIKTILG